MHEKDTRHEWFPLRSIPAHCAGIKKKTFNLICICNSIQYIYNIYTTKHGGNSLFIGKHIYIYIYMQIPNLVSSYPPESKNFDDGLLCTCIWFIPKVTSSSTIDSDVTVFGDVKRHLKNSRNVSHSAFGSTDPF